MDAIHQFSHESSVDKFDLNRQSNNYTHERENNQIMTIEVAVKDQHDIDIIHCTPSYKCILKSHDNIAFEKETRTDNYFEIDDNHQFSYKKYNVKCGINIGVESYAQELVINQNKAFKDKPRVQSNLELNNLIPSYQCILTSFHNIDIKNDEHSYQCLSTFNPDVNIYDNPSININAPIFNIKIENDPKPNYQNDSTCNLDMGINCRINHNESSCECLSTFLHGVDKNYNHSLYQSSPTLQSNIKKNEHIYQYAPTCSHNVNINAQCHQYSANQKSASQSNADIESRESYSDQNTNVPFLRFLRSKFLCFKTKK